MKKILINSFWSALVISVIISFTTYILPRFIFKSYYSANLVEGIKIGLMAFLFTFVIVFLAFLVNGLYKASKEKKKQKQDIRKRKRR